MANFTVDFVRAGDTLMVLNKEGGITQSDLNSVERQMLSATPVPGLLPVHIQEVNLQISLQYIITGKRMLSQCLKSDHLNISQFYSLLLQIVTVLNDSKNYMLSPDNYILEEDYIFVEGPLSCGILYLTYVPLKEREIGGAIQLKQASIQKKLLTLVTSLLSHVQSIEGSGVQQLLALCGGDIFSFQECKKLLITLLSGGSSPSSRSDSNPRVSMGAHDREMRSHSTISPSIEAKPHHNELHHNRRVEPKANAPTLQQPSPRTISQPVTPKLAHVPVEHVSASDELEQEEEAKPTLIKPIYALLGVIIIDALWWKYVYLNHQSTVNLYISIGITLLLGVAFWILRSGNFGSFPKKEDDFEEKWCWNKFEEEQSYDSLTNLNSTPHPSFSSNSSSSFSTIRSSISKEQNQPEIVVNQSSIKQTTFNQNEEVYSPSNNAATVLLQNDNNMEQGSKLIPTVHAYLERYSSEGGAAEKIVLNKNSFVIGRDSKLAQYIEQVVGVSRAHVELTMSSDGCTIKDLGSRNGTKLNSEWVAPYKEYPLQAGEIFVIAGVSYKYCVS